MGHEADDFTCPRCHENHTSFAGEICDECYNKEEHLRAAQIAAAAKKRAGKTNKDWKKGKK